MTLPARDDTAEVVQPREEAFDLPPAAFATERPAILRFRVAMGAVGRDQFNVVGLREMLVQAIAVVGAIPDQAGGERFDEAGRERGVDEPDFMR